jgi:Flp pilus assembly pilin Flp
MATDVGLWLLYRLQAIASSTRDERGQTLAEYGMIIALIATAVVVLAVFTFKDAIVGSFNGAETCLNNARAGIDPCR